MSVSREELDLLIRNPPEGFLLLDVRSSEELHHGTIKSSQNIPLDQVEKAFSLAPGDFLAAHGFRMPQKNHLIVTYCKSGRRGGMAVETLLRLGFLQTKVYPGSWDEWSATCPDNVTFIPFPKLPTCHIKEAPQRYHYQHHHTHPNACCVEDQGSNAPPLPHRSNNHDRAPDGNHENDEKYVVAEDGRYEGLLDETTEVNYSC